MISCRNKTYRDEVYQKPAIEQNKVAKNLSPQESLERMYLPKGYRMELVASEPMIAEPVAIAWDGNGKLYVAQMMTYMQDIDANDEDQPWSRISTLEDTDGDGKMDKTVVFLDSITLPRIMLPLDDRVIVGETYNRSLYSYRDTNGDGVADEKILLFQDTVRDNRNLEHQDANLLWSIDNWLYVTNKSLRYRFTDGKFICDTLPEAGSGQWGLTQDETGRLFFSRAGTEIPALGFQQHPSYGNLELENPWDESFMEPWPLIPTPDVQGGLQRIRPDSTLNRFTAVAGQEIFLGDKMPPAYGDLFIPEPVGRLVRRAKVNHVNGKITLENPYHQTEFLASTDPLFRPVSAATGPDGCLYIVDMYRGIIQEGNWVREGSYLRDVVKEKGFDKFIGRGRIYRIIHEDMTPGPTPDLLQKTAHELLAYLSHPNGWWRNMSQKLIILKGDKSVVSDLTETVQGNESFFSTVFAPDKDFALERLHALWTLEGLNSINASLLKTAYRDKDPRVRAAAIRISEPFLKRKNQEIQDALLDLVNDENPEVLQQLILTLRIQNESTKKVVKTILDEHQDNEIIKATAKESLDPAFNEIESLKRKYTMRGGDLARQIIGGYRIFKEYCSTCHGPEGKGIPQLAPPLVGSPRANDETHLPIKILLHGLTGPIDGKEYNGPMASVASESDEYISSVLTYVRIHLNNNPRGFVMRGSVKRTREKYADRNKYWTLKELEEDKKKNGASEIFRFRF